MATEAGGKQSTWLIVGASRGIGKEFVEQLLSRGDRVLATVRRDATSFWPEHRHQCHVLTCDVTSEKSIDVRLWTRLNRP
jgi:NAD(P)-dependent dehydrogenase (short-subunit alcohol dehydrogenase family)